MNWLRGLLRFSLHECGAGFSGVIFGLIVIHANVSSVEHYSIFGLFPVPAKLYAWALLIFWQLMFPGVSFLGHLGGVLVRDHSISASSCS